MDPEFGCRLLDIIPLPPWKEELVWNLHVTEYWEKRIPLSHYVQPAIGGISAHASQREEAPSFSQFGLLPAELQLRILSVCPTATLFQLMQTSSFLRTEASKLFWGNPDAYFVVEAYWLLSGGFPGYKSYDLAFLQNVQNLQIDYDLETDAHLWPQDTGSDIIQQDQIATFWQSVKWRFPNVRKIVLNMFREIDIPKRYNVVVPPLEALVEACPLTIEIRMLMSEMRPLSNAQADTEIQPVATWQRCAYRLTSNHTWTELESRHSQTILLPIGGFTGLVGRFESLLWKWKRICLHRDSLWPLAIEALDRYHFDQGRNNPFICPFDDCNAYFDKAGEWTVHAATWHVPFFDRVRGSFPEEIRLSYEQRERWIKEMRRELCGKQCRSIWQEWTNAGADEQATIERDWRRQLEAKRLGDVSEQAIRKEKHIWERFVDTANGTDEHWIREVDMYVDDEE